MSWADVEAMQALVEQIPALASATYITLVPKPASGQPPIPYPYALIHPLGGTDTQERHTGPWATEHPEFTLHLVGDSAEQCQALVDLLKAIVKPNGVGIIPAVSGRKNGQMFWRMPLPIQTSTSLEPPMCFAVIETGWTSDPS